jgi:cupin superfamily acireductone dioxygenase involved in methionine salvage
VTPSSHADGGIRCLWIHESTIRSGFDIHMSKQCQNWDNKLNLRSETQNRKGTATAIKRLDRVRHFMTYLKRDFKKIPQMQGFTNLTTRSVATSKANLPNVAI